MLATICPLLVTAIDSGSSFSSFGCISFSFNVSPPATFQLEPRTGGVTSSPAAAGQSRLLRLEQGNDDDFDADDDDDEEKQISLDALQHFLTLTREPVQ